MPMRLILRIRSCPRTTSGTLPFSSVRYLVAAHRSVCRLILNEPAGKVALIVVKHTVELIVEAWYDHNRDVGATINQVCPSLS